MSDPAAALDRAYAALQVGQLGEIQTIYAELEPVFTSPLPPMTKGQATALRQKALRNARSLEAALAGVRAAKRRVEEVLRAQDGLTYTATGTFSALPKLAARLSRKL